MSTTDEIDMIEILLCLLIISLTGSLSLRNITISDYEHYYFMNDYLYTQSLAMKNREHSDYDKGITFNSMGHVFQAETITIGNHQVIIHLGNGYVTGK